MFGLLPHNVYEILSKPGAIVIPKIINIVAGIIVLTLLVRRWVPNEIRDREERIKSLQESENRYRNLIEKMPVALIWMSLDEKYIFRNDRFVRLFGYTEEVVPTVEEWWPHAYPDPVYREQVIQVWQQDLAVAVAGNKDIEAKEYLVTCHSGEQRTIEISGIVLQEGVLITFVDLSERALAHEEIAKSRAEFAAIFNAISDGIVFVDAERRIVNINPAFTMMFGYQLDEIAGQTTQLIYADPDHYLRQGQTRFNPGATVERPVFENEYRRKDGTTFPGETIGVHVIDETGQLLGYIGVIHDASERKLAEGKREKLEAQLHQSQKIESVGRLAGGVAHDYNNMLSVIIGNVELAQMKAKRSAPLNDNLEHILEAAIRSRDITRQLLAFARKQIIIPKVLDLNEVVESMLKMLRTLLGENIDLIWQPKGGLWRVKIDSSQLDQVLANLCINARDAISGNGKMTIETDSVSFDEEYCKDHPGFLSGNYVVLSVSDNGCGMDKETLDNVFEPFFTTKPTGEGTGLGMATVYGIVKQSGGFINAYSELNQGTTFKIYFPRHEGENVVSQGTTVSDIQMGQGETVLLVEDEIAIVELATAMLEDLGYRVLPTNSPVEALKLLKEFQGDIQLLLTDVVMPGMNGRELAKQVREIHPEMKALYMSGYTANVIAHHGVLDEGINFIQKPFSRRDLSHRVREILDSNS